MSENAGIKLLNKDTCQNPEEMHLLKQSTTQYQLSYPVTFSSSRPFVPNVAPKECSDRRYVGTRSLVSRGQRNWYVQSEIMCPKLMSNVTSIGLFITEALHPFEVFQKAGFEVDLVSETGTYQPDWLSQQKDWLSDSERAIWEDHSSEFRSKLDHLLQPNDIDPAKACHHSMVTWITGC